MLLIRLQVPQRPDPDQSSHSSNWLDYEALCGELAPCPSPTGPKDCALFNEALLQSPDQRRDSSLGWFIYFSYKDYSLPSPPGTTMRVSLRSGDFDCHHRSTSCMLFRREQRTGRIGLAGRTRLTSWSGRGRRLSQGLIVQHQGRKGGA